MSGKSYTMREMKAIVEYLTEHRAYSEVKGRKMWMDLASTNITNRTWQSLKETFLKRILPDIHNPYYRLSVTQISSFQQGQDIDKKMNNRLEIRSTSQNSDFEGVKEQDTEKPGNDNNINEEEAGEDSKQADLRASTETLVLDDCYENAEEIKKDLQSSDDNVEDDSKVSQPTKSLRELITYSEPLTPMLQSVIDDFATDDEERASRMQIVEPEEIPETDKNSEKTSNNEAIEISDSDGNDIQGNANQKLANKSEIAHPSSPHEIQQEQVTSNNTDIEVINDNVTTSLTKINDTNNSTDGSAVKIVEDSSPKNSSEFTQTSANMTDTLLPGNQEAFKENIKKKSDKHSELLNRKSPPRNGRKRASSQDPESKTKKRLLSKVKSISDTEKLSATNRKVFNKSKHSLNKNLPEDKGGTSLTMDTEIYESQTVQEMEVADNTQSPAQIQNPCLNNVNLYAEQFSNEKYIDSDENKRKDDKTDKDLIIKNKDNETINSQDTNKTQIDKEQKNKNQDTEITNSQDINNTQFDKHYKTQKDKTKKTVIEKSAVKYMNTENDNVNIKDKYGNNEEEIKKKTNNDNTFDNIKKLDKNRKIDEKDTTNNKNTKEYDSEKSAAIQTCEQDNANVLTLQSHSGSASETGNPAMRGEELIVKQRRDRALANMFGFTSGGTIRRHRQSTNRRRRNKSHSRSRTFKVSSASSEWTSDTSSEYVSSPPRQRGPKGRYTRKYLKPKSAPILSLEEEGGLFVMYGKKIYPIVRDGKTVKNYVTYTAEDDVDQEESFWKLKYVEEKKKNAELTKLLNQAKDNKRDPSVGEPSRDPAMLPTTTQKNDDCIILSDDTGKDVVKPVPAEVQAETACVQRVPEPKPTSEDKKTVIIKFIKQDKEVQLEGHWSQLNPVLPHVAQLFQQEPTPRSSFSSKTDLQPADVHSGISTPMEDVVKKVNQRENEIAKEIEMYYNEEISAPEQPQTSDRAKRVAKNIKVGDTEQHHEETPEPEASTLESNVTKRRGRPRKVSPADSPSAAKKGKVDTESESNAPEQPAAQTNVTTVRTRRTNKTRTFTDTDQSNRTYTVRTRKSTSRQSVQKTIDTNETGVVNEDEEILYKFPPQAISNRKSYANKSIAQSPVQNVDKRRSKRENTIKKQQGVINTSRTFIKNKSETGSTSSSELHCAKHLQYMTNLNITEDLSESSVSFQCDHIESVTFQNSTITSEIYKTDSYLMLMNENPLKIKNSSKLDKIKEVRDFDINEDACDEIVNSNNTDPQNKENIPQINIDNENSSNTSLPTSPVLSIVENISINKTLLSSIDLADYSVGDKPEDIDENGQILLNELMSPNADVAMPLMETECGIEKSTDNGKEYHYNLRNFKTAPTVSDSLLHKIDTVNIEDPSISESLNVKLRNLLLESNKKKLKRVNIETENMEVENKSGPTKTKSRKRSSTPRKRQRKQTITNTEPHVMAEHTETCSQRGRESCPPVILITQHESKTTMTPPVTESAQHLAVKPTKRNKKKDIIKVKISKPKTQIQASEENYKTTFTDSGINDTASEIKLSSDDSVEYIHNHSDTCLNAHECMEDSVQIVEKTAESLIILDSNSAFSDLACDANIENLMQGLYNNDVQDKSGVVEEIKQVNSAATSVYHSPHSSIMTEDLTVDIPEEPVQNSKWYLLSEQESSSSNFYNVNENSEKFEHINFAHLKQLFPIACAVPDLSTISENSRETGNSKKSSETDMEDILKSPNIFI